MAPESLLAVRELAGARALVAVVCSDRIHDHEAVRSAFVQDGTGLSHGLDMLVRIFGTTNGDVLEARLQKGKASASVTIQGHPRMHSPLGQGQSDRRWRWFGRH